MKTASLKKDTAECYRVPMPVTHFTVRQNMVYYMCPRCQITVEREFMAYCDRCGQCLNWSGYRKAVRVK